ERCDITVHAEDAVGRQYGGLRRALGEQPARGSSIAMRVAPESRSGQEACIDEGCMAQAVEQHGFAARRERGHHPEVGHVSRREKECTRTAKEGGELFLERRMFPSVAADQM